MIKQVLELSHASFVSLKDGQLVVEQDRKVVLRTPVEDLGLLLLSHPANVVTQQALMACQRMGTAVVVCDEHYLPISLLLPLAGGSLHSQTLHTQVSADPEAGKQLWKAIVSMKISAQAALLSAVGKPSARMTMLARRVSPGDAGNCESQAAAVYWKALFGRDFRRGSAAEPLNAMLNYGYAVLRAAVARAIVGAGLHPAWGLCHHNRGDNFALADDLMEPLRPAVDECIFKHRGEAAQGVTGTLKRAVLEILSAPAEVSGQPLPLWVALQRYAASLKEALTLRKPHLEIPEWRFSADIARCG